MVRRCTEGHLHGRTHYFENHWYEGERDWSEIYLLQPLNAETFTLAMEDREIWLRWEKSRKEGRTTQATHPALPEDRKRHEEHETILNDRLVAPPGSSVKARVEFIYGPQAKVRWSVIQEATKLGKPLY